MLKASLSAIRSNEGVLADVTEDADEGALLAALDAYETAVCDESI